MVVAEKQVKSILNKMTKEKFARLAKQMVEIPILSHDMLTMMIANVYEKAIDEPAFGDMYADLCAMLSKEQRGAGGGANNSYVHIIESDEEPPTEDGSSAPPGAGAGDESTSNKVYRWSNDVGTSDDEIVGPFASTEECMAAALDSTENSETTPVERGDMKLVLEKCIIKQGMFIKIMKTAASKGDGEVEEGQEDESKFYCVYFPVADHEECGQQLSGIFLSQRECEVDSTKQNSFKRSLLNKCQDEFQKQDIFAEWKEEKAKYEEGKASMTEAEQAEKEEDLEFRRIKIKKQMHGNVKFIGQLYKKNLLKERIMRICICGLIKIEAEDPESKNSTYKDVGTFQDMDEEDHEAIGSMFTTIGLTIDQPSAALFMKACFDKIERLSVEKQLNSRLRFMYKDLIDLRANKWVPRRKVEKAKTLDEIKKEFEMEERAQEEQSRQQNQKGNYRGSGGNRGGGGGRGGSGDYRNNSRQSSTGGNYNRRQSAKPVVTTDEDGFTTISSGSKPSRASMNIDGGRSAGGSNKKTLVTKSSFAALDDDSNKATGGPAPLDKDKFTRRVKTILKEFEQDPGNTKELLLSFDELTGTPEYSSLFISANADFMWDCKNTERVAMFNMIDILFENKKLGGDAKDGLVDSIEFIDSFACDSPRAYEFLGELLAKFFAYSALDMTWFCEQCEKSKMGLAENPEKIIKATAEVIATKSGKDGVQAVFGGSNRAQLEKLLGDKAGEVLGSIM